MKFQILFWIVVIGSIVIGCISGHLVVDYKNKWLANKEIRLIPNDTEHPPERYIDEQIKKLLVQRMKLHPDAVIGKMYMAKVVFEYADTQPLFSYFAPDLQKLLSVQTTEVVLDWSIQTPIV